MTDNAPSDQTPPAGEPDSPGGDREQHADTISAEDARKLRSEARNLRERAKNAERKLEKLQGADLTEHERKDKRLQELETRNGDLERQLRTMRAQVAAQNAGLIDPELAALAVDWDSIDNPEDPKQLDRAMRDLAERKPHLVGQRGFDGGAGTGRKPSSSTDMNQLIRQAAGRT